MTWDQKVDMRQNFLKPTLDKVVQTGYSGVCVWAYRCVGGCRYADMLEQSGFRSQIHVLYDLHILAISGMLTLDVYRYSDIISLYYTRPVTLYIIVYECLYDDNIIIMYARSSCLYIPLYKYIQPTTRDRGHSCSSILCICRISLCVEV